MDIATTVDAVSNCPFVAIPGLPVWAAPVICIAYAVLEAWLGQTDKVKAGSLLGLIASPLMKKTEEKP